ncbi:MAG: PdxA family dehydrogenase [Myxococcota bacterium]
MSRVGAGRPRIGITMGDPAGIGPEITRAALARLGDRAEWTIYGPPGLYPGVEARFVPPRSRPPEREAVERSAADLRDGAIDGVVTAPVTKACFGGDFPGHTELYGARLGVSDFAMMLAGPKLRVVPVTTHVALRDAPDLLSRDLLVRAGRLVHRALRDRFGIPTPRLAFPGLNPHAGDGGLFGDEEARLIAPAVEALRAEGVEATGPWSPDTVFHFAARGDHDAVICGYHDQALIPFKMLHFSDGVNVTLGLPRPRTSPDHGPALDIAGRGTADPTSMTRAIELAVRLA